MFVRCDLKPSPQTVRWQPAGWFSFRKEQRCFLGLNEQWDSKLRTSSWRATGSLQRLNWFVSDRGIGRFVSTSPLIRHLLRGREKKESEETSG